MKKILLTFMSTMVLLFSVGVFAEVPVTLMKSTQSISADQMINIVKQNINLDPQDYYAAKVQVIFKENKKIDYLLVYLLSAKDYSFTITQIKLGENDQVISVTPNYHLLKQDLAQQPGANAIPVCPDNSVEFVAATPVPGIRTANAVVRMVYQAALANGYKAREFFGSDATVVAYENWLVCPHLKGFFNVGHGDKHEIFLDDGVLSHSDFSTTLKKKLGEHVVVLFNSCEVMNDPLKSAVITDADAQKYAGGITSLGIGLSEPVSNCFWNRAFAGRNLTISLKECSRKELRNKFGIDGLGSDRLELPN